MPTPRKRIICWAVLAWFIVREFDVLLTVLTLKGPVGQRFSQWDFFDAKFYVFLAEHGYLFGHTADSAFFPLYPFTGHLLILAQMPPLVALLLISSGAALAAGILVGLWSTTRRCTSKPLSGLFCCWPSSPLGVFLSAPYCG